MRVSPWTLWVALICLWVALICLGNVAPVWAQKVHTLSGHSDTVYSVAYSPDGRLLISGSFDTTARVWDVAHNRTVREIADRTQGLTRVAFNHEGQLLATAGMDRQVRLYDVPRTSSLAAVEDQPDAMLAMDVSGDGQWLISGDWKGRVKLWKAESLEFERDLLPEGPRVRGLAFSPDGKQVLVADEEKRLSLVDFESGELLGRCRVPNFEAFAASRDGRTLVTGDDKGWLRVIGGPLRPTTTLEGPDAAMRTVAASRDGRTLAAAGDKGHVLIYAGDGNLRHTLEHDKAISRVAVSADGQRVAAVDDSGHLLVWATADGKPQGQLMAHLEKAMGVAFHPNGQQLATSGKDNAVRIWQLPIAESSREDGSRKVTAGLTSLDAKSGLLLGDKSDKAEFVNLADGKTQRELDAGGEIVAAGIRRDGAQAVFGTNNKKLRAVNTNNGSQVAEHEVERRITAVALDPAGGTIAWADDNKRIHLIKTGDGETIHELEGLDRNAHELAFTPDGRRLISLEERHVRVWEVANGKQERSIHRNAPLVSLALSRDGRLVACSSNDHAWVFQVDDAQELAYFERVGRGEALAFSADGKRLLCGMSDRWIKLLRIEDRRLLQQEQLEEKPRLLVAADDGRTALAIEESGYRTRRPTPIVNVLPHDREVHAVTYIPNGTHLLSGAGDNRVRLWELAQTKIEREFHTSNAIRDVAVSGDTKYVAAGAHDNRVRVWLYGNGEEVLNHDTHNAIESVTFSPDNRRVAVAGSSNTARVLDLESKQVLELFTPDEGALRAVAFLPEDRVLVGGDAQWLRIEPASVRGIGQPDDKSIRTLAFAPDGNRLYVSSGDRQVFAWQTNNLTRAHDFPGPERIIRSLAVSQSGSILAGGGDDNRIRLWDANSGRQIAEHHIDTAIHQVAVDRDGQHVVAALANRDILTLSRERIDNTDVLQIIQQAAGHKQTINAVAFRPEDQRLWTASQDMQLRTWFVATAKPRKTFSGHSDLINALAFSPDDTRLATASVDRTVRVWDTDDAQTKATLSGHEASVYAVAWRPAEASGSGPALVTASSDQTIRFWAANGQPIKTGPDPLSDGLYSVAFSPDGRRVVAGGLDGHWHLFEVGKKTPDRSVEASGDYLYSVVYSPNGQKLVTLSYGGELAVWNAGNGERLHHQQLPLQAGYQLVYSPTGEEVAVAGMHREHAVLRIELPGHAR